MAHTVGQFAKGIGACRVDQVHRHHHQRNECHGHAALLRTQHQECFAETRQCGNRSDGHDPPIGASKPGEIGALDGVGAARTDVALGFAHAKRQERNRQHARNHRHPKHRAEIVGPKQHQADTQKRAGEGAHGVERLAQAKGRSPQMARRDVGNQRVAWRAAHAFAHPVEQPRRHDEAGSRGDGKQGLRRCAQGVAEYRQALALAKVVAQGAGKDLDDQGGGFGQPFDHSHGEGAGP